MRAPAAICVVVLLPLALTACGDQPSGSPGQRSEPAEWRTEHVAGEISVDFPTLLATGGDDALVLMLSDEGILQSHLSRDGADFRAGDPLDLEEQYAALGDVVRLDDGSWLALGTAGGVEVAGDTQSTHDPLALRSEDGLTWRRVDVTGFSEPVDLNDMEVFDGRIVVVGDYRTLSDRGGFEARVWTSVDGRSFDEVRLPDVPDYQGYDDESYAADVVTVDGDLLASGRIGDRAALWRSTDAGATWARVAPPELRNAYAISGIEVRGRTVVASTSAEDVQTIRSEDGGRTWEAVRSLPVNEEADGWAPLWSAGQYFLTLTGIYDESWSRPEVCYADIAQCAWDRQPRPRLVASSDGAEWTAIDVPGDEEVWTIAGTADGRVLAMAEERGGVAVYSWPAGAELPAADDPAEPETVELVTLPDDEEPEVGVRYHEPMYVHCGMDWLWFGDTTWRRTDDGPGVETGAGQQGPDGWPLAEQEQTLYGFATVLADGTLEYSLEDGTVIATYERRSGAPGCD